MPHISGVSKAKDIYEERMSHVEQSDMEPHESRRTVRYGTA